MKPRIRLYRGIWHCYHAASRGHVGMGYTPEHAYLDWWAYVRDYWTKGEAALSELVALSNQMGEQP